MKKKILVVIFCFILMILLLSFRNNNLTNKVVSYNGNDLRISVDGKVSSTLPTTGTYYLVDYDCSSTNTKITWDNTNYKLNVSNGMKKAGVSCYLNFKSKPLLSEMPVGSYVKYTGNNGCTGESCNGYNANYVSDTDMGYCSSSNYKFYTNGWRIGYIENGSAYLVSAGATDCMCTSSDGTASSSSCSNYLSSTDLYKHFDNMDVLSLNYCNSDYANGGVCDNTTTWAMDATDFEKITGNALSSSSCYNSYSNTLCGYNNDLIDNGGYYWYAIAYSSSSNLSFLWSPSRIVNGNSSSYLSGVRPVLYLESSVIVTGGSGTYEDPYVINNNSFLINDGASYINSSDDLGSVQLSLNVADDDVQTMCISVDSSICTNYIDFSETYTLDWSNEEDGEKIVYVYYKNSDGEIVASMNRSIIIDTDSPTNSSVSIDFEDGFYGTLTLASTGANYMCLSDTSSSSNDCTEWVNYATTYNWTFDTGTGSKTIYAFFKDEAGNIVGPYSDSMTCTNNCEFKYFMDAYNNSYIYLVRSDGATAQISTSGSSITWYSEGSQSMNVCGKYNYSSGGYFWCIGTDNNAYYKTSNTSTSWSKVSISDYIDVSSYSYSIYPYSTSYAYIVRSDGKTNRISTSGLASTSWSYGYSRDMAVCSGYSSSRVICVGLDGYYYYRTSYSTTTDYSGGSIVKLTDRTKDNTWIDMYSNTYAHIIESDGTNLYNARFSYSTTSASWYTSTIPGNGVKTCATSGYSTYNYCLGEDGYLYYKSYSSTGWTKLSSFTYE